MAGLSAWLPGSPLSQHCAWRVDLVLSSEAWPLGAPTSPGDSRDPGTLGWRSWNSVVALDTSLTEVAFVSSVTFCFAVSDPLV